MIVLKGNKEIRIAIGINHVEDPSDEPGKNTYPKLENPNGMAYLTQTLAVSSASGNQNPNVFQQPSPPKQPNDDVYPRIVSVSERRTIIVNDTENTIFDYSVN